MSPHYQFIYGQTWVWKEEPFVLKHIVVRGKFHHHCVTMLQLNLASCINMNVCVCARVRACMLVCVCAHVCVFMSMRENILVSKLEKGPISSDIWLLWRFLTLVASAFSVPHVARHSSKACCATAGTVALRWSFGCFSGLWWFPQSD